MGKLIMVTGGARSGKSTFAEEAAKNQGDKIIYIATSIAFDEEMKLRVKKHREQRPVFWETIEAYKDMDIHLRDGLNGMDAVMLDCITIMVTNLMMEKIDDWENIDGNKIIDTEKYVQHEMQKLVQIVEASPIPFILVTNEVGMGIVPEYKSGRLFRDIAGRVNQMLAKAADEVFLCVSGIPVKIK